MIHFFHLLLLILLVLVIVLLLFLMFTLWRVLFGSRKIGKSLLVKGIKYRGIFVTIRFLQHVIDQVRAFRPALP